MKTLRLHASGKLRIHDEPAPIPDASQDLLQVKAVGICGSDLHWFSQGSIGDAQLEHPLVLGHEFAGITSNGQVVAVDPAIPCRHCEYCLAGNPNLCEQVLFAGHGSQDGALQEQIAWDKRNLFPLPEPLTCEDGAMLEPLGVAIHAVDLAGIQCGMAIGVYGCGPIGLLIIQLARLSGATSILATDVLPHRLEAAIAYGATKTLLANNGVEIQQIMHATRGRGVDVAFEAAGEQEAVDVVFSTVIPGGKVILLGIPASDQTTFTASLARRKGLTIKMVRRMKNTYPRAIELVSKQLVDVRSIISHRFSLDQASQAFQLAKNREGNKIIIVM